MGLRQDLEESERLRHRQRQEYLSLSSELATLKARTERAEESYRKTFETLAATMTDLRVAEEQAKVLKQYMHKIEERIFQQNNIRAKHDPYYRAIRAALRQVFARGRGDEKEAFRQAIDSLLVTNTELDPERLMHIAEEYGISIRDEAQFKKWVEEWREMKKERDTARAANDEEVATIDVSDPNFDLYTDNPNLAVQAMQSYVRERVDHDRKQGDRKGDVRRRTSNGRRKRRATGRRRQEPRRASPEPAEAH